MPEISPGSLKGADERRYLTDAAEDHLLECMWAWWVRKCGMKTKQTSYKIPEPICHQVLHVPTINNLVRNDRHHGPRVKDESKNKDGRYKYRNMGHTIAGGSCLKPFRGVIRPVAKNLYFSFMVACTLKVNPLPWIVGTKTCYAYLNTQCIAFEIIHEHSSFIGSMLIYMTPKQTKSKHARLGTR